MSTRSISPSGKPSSVQSPFFSPQKSLPKQRTIISPTLRQDTLCLSTHNQDIETDEKDDRTVNSSFVLPILLPANSEPNPLEIMPVQPPLICLNALETKLAHIHEETHKGSLSPEQLAEEIRQLEDKYTLSFEQQGNLYKLIHEKYPDSMVLAPYKNRYKARASIFKENSESVVRSREELTPSDVKAAIKYDRHSMTPETMKAILARGTYHGDEILARQVLYHMSQWSTPDGLNGMLEALFPDMNESGSPVNNHNSYLGINNEPISDIETYLRKDISTKKIIGSGTSSLADTLRYLTGKGSAVPKSGKAQASLEPPKADKAKPLYRFYRRFNTENSIIEDIATKEGKLRNSLILVDRYVLNSLRQNPALAEKIKTSNITLAIPVGWESGGNLFSLHSPEALGQRLYEVCEQVYKQEYLEGVAPDYTNPDNLAIVNKAIQNVLQEPVRATLNEIFNLKLPTKGLIKRLLFFNNPQFSVDTWATEESLVKQFKEKQKLKKKMIESFLLEEDLETADLKIEPELEKLAHRIPPEQRQPFLEWLGQGLQVFTAQRMSIEFQKLHAHVMSMAEKAGIPSNHIFLYIPDTDRDKTSVKSHTLVTHQYATVNHISPNQILNDLHQLPKFESENGKYILMVLDDFSASGHSLAAVADRLDKKLTQQQKQNGTVLIIPNVATQKSVDLLTKGGKFHRLREKDVEYTPKPFIQYVPGAISLNFRQTPYYQSLSGLDRSEFDMLLEKNGYEGCSTFTGFWWMSPTNNVRSRVGKEILEQMMLNRVGYR